MMCHHREIGYTIRNRLLTGEGLFSLLEVVALLDAIALLNYGIWWTQPEDIGYSIGMFVKQIFGVTLEMFTVSDSDWICPQQNTFDSRETYSDWVVGKW